MDTNKAPKTRPRGERYSEVGKERGQVCQGLARVFAEVKGDRTKPRKRREEKRTGIQKERVSKRKGKREMEGVLGRRE